MESLRLDKGFFFVGVKAPDVKIEPPPHQRCSTVREVLLSLPPPGEPGNEDLNRTRIVSAKNPIVHGSPYTSDLLFNGKGRVLNLDSVARTLPAIASGNHAPIVDTQWLRGGSSWVQPYHDHLKAGGERLSTLPSFPKEDYRPRSGLLPVLPSLFFV